MEGISQVISRLALMQKSWQNNENVQHMNQTNQITTTSFDCPKCKDEEGYLIRDEQGYERWRECDCKERKRAQRIMRMSELTEELRKLGFKNFKLDGRPQCVKEAYEKAREYCKTFDQIRNTRYNSMSLLGTPGTGKTHLLVAALNNLMYRNISCLYFPHVEGFNNLKNNLDDLETKINYMKTVDVLYWDDLFKGRKAPTDFQLEQIFAVINYRYLNNKPILISSEKTIDELMNIDGAIASRIYEMSKGHTVVMKLGPNESHLTLNYRLED